MRTPLSCLHNGTAIVTRDITHTVSGTVSFSYSTAFFVFLLKNIYKNNCDINSFQGNKAGGGLCIQLHADGRGTCAAENPGRFHS